ncbi:hypothetical protein F4775DRAFT_600677 [Biscogniauxia sp. FL1348]|nr:hypothetical protein F4775DRAFT_600677 [Biscogniauxia sp. FL1348]
MQPASGDVPFVRARVANACDNCKQRKVKCDGKLPCSYCTRRRRAHSCRFSPRRRLNAPSRPGPPSSPSSSRHGTATPRRTPGPIPIPIPIPAQRNSGGGDASADEEAIVPREARLVCDEQGKLIFIGDCAPLSLFQTVRQIVTSRVDARAFAPESSRVSMLENVGADQTAPCAGGEPPPVDAEDVGRLVEVYITATSALVDLFDNARLPADIASWCAQPQRQPADVNATVTAAVHYLVLAIGAQSADEEPAATYFLHAKNLALSSLGGTLSIGTVQAFVLVTLYMVRSCQTNGAFLFFGIAVRAAYSIGIHRTELNSRFGADVHYRRDRLWKSLRVLDLFLSISMGRPPATSDSDCTVPYQSKADDGGETFDLLNASVQVLLIAEGIVLEVYHRRKITLQLTEGISRQLREWSGRWLAPLLRSVADMAAGGRRDASVAVGACQALSSYYYAVMLVSRPFLIYELCKRLPESTTAAQQPAGDTNSGRSKLANACIDAACLMIEMVLDLVERGVLDQRMPLLVSWLFAASLVVGVGLLGGFGRRVLEKHARMSVAALDHFAAAARLGDAHAMQYALLARALLSTALDYLDRQETRERRRTTEASSLLFGLVPPPPPSPPPAEQQHAYTGSCDSNHDHDDDDGPFPRPLVTSDGGGGGGVSHETTPAHQWAAASGLLGDIDPGIFSLGSSIISPASASAFPFENQHNQTDQVFGALNLFPLLEGNGHVDLAHYL